MKTKMNQLRMTFMTLAAALVLAAPSLFAVSTDTWVGGTGNNFSTVGNWTYSSGSGPVATGDSLVFSTVGSTTPNNDLSSLSFPNITFGAGALGFTVGGNSFTLGTAGTALTVSSANAQTINNNIALGNVAQTFSLASGNLTLGGVVSGGGNTLTISGGQTLTLSGANTFTGTTALSAGTIKVGHAAALGASRINIANGPTLDLNGNNLSVAFINNSAALTGGIIDNVSAGGTVTLTVGSGVGGVNAVSGTYTSIDSFSGIIKNTTGTVGLTKVSPILANQTAGIMATASLLNGPNVLRLMNANTYTGPTTVNGGILDINLGNANNGGAALTANAISSSSALVLAGGDVILDGVGTALAQTFASVTLNAGASHIGNYRNTSGTANLTLNAITRNTGSTVDIASRPTGASSNAKIGAADGVATSTTVNANFTGGQQTILGGYATINTYVSGGGGGWAATGTGAGAKTIITLAAYNAGFLAAKDVDAATGTTTPAAMTINSLRFNTAGAYTVNSAGNIVVATGGILETLTVGANAVAINNNNLTSGNGQDLIIHQYNTGGGMTIGANITDNGGAIGLTKSGTGTLTLTPNTANTFSGQLTLNAGTVLLGNASALNGIPPVVFGGMSQTLGGTAPNFTFVNGTLNLNGNSASVASLSSSADSSGTPTVQNASATPATLTVNMTTTKTFTGVLQDGTGGGALSVTKSGTGVQTLSGVNTYTGNTTISAGTIALSGSGALASGSTVSIAAGGSFDVSALGASATYTFGSSATLKASGTGTTLGTTAANIVAGSSGIFNLGSRPVSLTWGGSSSGTDSTHPPLNVSQGTLSLSGNVITVVVPGTALAPGTYTLISAPAITGTPNATPSYTGGNGVGVGNTGVISVSGGTVILTVSGPTGSIATWITDGNGNIWSVATNWNPNSVPHLAGDAATLGVSTALRTITLDTNETVGTLAFTNANSFVVADGGSKTLTLDNSGSGASVTVSDGTANNIQATVALNEATAITVSGGKQLTLSGTISNASGTRILTLNGAGTTILSTANTYGPASSGTTGTALSGGGTVQVNNSSSFGAGDVNVTGNTILKSGAASLSLANPIAVASTIVATVDNNGNDLTLSGVISGSGALSKSSSGTLTLSGVNTFSGGTTINAGTLGVSADLNVGAAPGSATPNNLVLNGGDLLGNGTFTLAANRGVGIGAVAGTATTTALIDVASGQTLTLNGVVASAGNSGVNNLTVNSLAATPGTLILGGANTFNGTTIISSSILQLANSLALRNSTLDYSSGTLSFGSLTAATFGGLTGSQNLTLQNGSSAAVALTVGNNNVTSSYTRTLSGSGSLIKSGTGTFTLGSGASGGASYTGATTVNAGTLNIGGVGSITGSAGNVSLSGLSGSCTMSLADSAAISTSGNIFVCNDGGAGSPAGICTLTLKNTASLGGASLVFGNNSRIPNGCFVTVQDSAALTLSGNLDLNLCLGTTAQTDAVNLNGGTTTVGGFISTVGSATHQSAIHFNGGVLKPAASSATFLPALSGLTASVDSGGASIDTGSFDITIAANLLHGTGTPDGGLTKAGNGTLTLSGASTYTGATAVNAGRLAVNGSTAAGSAVTVASSATLGGSGTVNGSVTINSGGFLAAGNSIGTLTLAGAPTLNGTVTAELDASASPNADKVVVSSGTLTYGGTLTVTNIGAAITTNNTFTLFNAPGYSGTFASLNLPSGGLTHWKTNNLVVDGTITYTNNAPVGQDQMLGAALGDTVSLQVIGGKKAPSDVDSDSLAITAVSAASSGTSGFDATNVTYVASGSTGTNTFTYTISDGFGGLATNTVTVVVSNPQGFNQLSATNILGTAYLTYLGIPGTNYALDITHDLPATNWTAVVTNVAATNGYLFFTNPVSLFPTNDYYRTHYVP